MNQQTIPEQPAPSLWIKFIGLSSIGLFMFFIPINLDGVKTIPIDHIVAWIKLGLGEYAKLYVLIMITAGTIFPVVTGSWQHKPNGKHFQALKCLGLLLTAFAISGAGPALLHEADMLPFLLNKLVIPVGLIAPIGSIFLTLLISYGLLESTGTLLLSFRASLVHSI